MSCRNLYIRASYVAHIQLIVVMIQLIHGKTAFFCPLPSTSVSCCTHTHTHMHFCWLPSDVLYRPIVTHNNSTDVKPLTTCLARYIRSHCWWTCNNVVSHVHFYSCTQAKVQHAQVHKLNWLVPTHQTAGEVKTSATGTATPGRGGGRKSANRPSVSNSRDKNNMEWLRWLRHK